MVAEHEVPVEAYDYTIPDHWRDYWIMDPENPKHHWEITHMVYVDRVVELVKESGSRSVLELGCGDGFNCSRLVESGLDQVVGVDWSPNAIRYAKALVPKARFYCGDLRDVNWKSELSEPFDAGILVEVIEHIPPKDCVEVLRSMTQQIKVGGLLVLTTPSVNTPNNNPGHYRHFDEKTLREMVAEAGGLSITAIEGYGDAIFARRTYHWLRFFNNRYYEIKPVKRWIWGKCYKSRCKSSSLDVCAGFVMTMQRVS
jgi:2-polyprenyl-3-methyl-5-hydroxy-6-metoxy-1,4-benzoquinol methylase